MHFAYFRLNLFSQKFCNSSKDAGSCLPFGSATPASAVRPLPLAWTEADFRLPACWPCRPPGPQRTCLLYTMAHIAVAWPHIWPAAMHKRFFYYCALIKCKYFYSLGFSWPILYCNPHYIAAIFSKHIYSQRFVRRWVRRKKFSPSLINCLTLKL